MRVLVLGADDTSPDLGGSALTEGASALVRSVCPAAEVDLTSRRSGGGAPR
jgi:hypothetical protein